MKPFLTLKTAKAMAEAADKKATDHGHQRFISPSSMTAAT
jgi:hypothetical protein